MIVDIKDKDLAKAHKKCRYSQTILARELGVHRQQLHMWIKYEKDPENKNARPMPDKYREKLQEIINRTEKYIGG
jgi:DNA-binding XRE family transcriptional regulator